MYLETIEKINKQGFVDFEDIENLKAVTNFEKINSVLSYLEKIAGQLGFNYSDLLKLFNLKEVVETQFESSFLQSLLKNIDGLPQRFYEVFLKQDSELTKELSEILSTIYKNVDATIIYESHVEVQFELLLRSVFGYRDMVKKTLITTKAYNLAVNIMQVRYPSLIGIIKEKLNIKSE